MPTIHHPIADTEISTGALAPFLAITFAVTWGSIGVYVVAPDMAAGTLGEISRSHPVFFLATWSPAIAAFAVVLTRSGGSGLRRFLSRLLLWRCPVGWVALIVVGLPLVFVVGSLIKSGPIFAPLPPGGVGPVVALLLLMLALGPVEEFGWRGVMQPLLQRHMAPVWAGLVIGATWGLWHLPAFFLSSTVYAEWSFLPFLVGNVALAVLVTPILNDTRGSLLWPMSFHWQLINPVWPEARPWDTVILVVLAVLVVWWNREAMFSRSGAVNEVVPPGSAHVASIAGQGG